MFLTGLSEATQSVAIGAGGSHQCRYWYVSGVSSESVRPHVAESVEDPAPVAAEDSQRGETMAEAAEPTATQSEAETAVPRVAPKRAPAKTAAAAAGTSTRA